MKKLTKLEMANDILEIKDLMINQGKKAEAFKILKKYNDCTYSSKEVFIRFMMYNDRETLSIIRGEFMTAK